jgi:hypothetical protein
VSRGTRLTCGYERHTPGRPARSALWQSEGECAGRGPLEHGREPQAWLERRNTRWGSWSREAGDGWSERYGMPATRSLGSGARERRAPGGGRRPPACARNDGHTASGALVGWAPAGEPRVTARCGARGQARVESAAEQVTSYVATAVAVITLLAAIYWTAVLPAL